MKKDAYYFPHFSNARNDSKLVKLRRVMGIEGYGMYFLLLETLREQTDFKLPISNLEDLAYEWHTSKEKLMAVVTNFDLFKIIEDKFISVKLIAYLQPYIEKSERARLAANKRWDNANAYANALPEHSKCNANQNAKRGEERKVKESKVNKFNFKNELIKIGVSELIAKDWMQVRKNKKATNTLTAFNSVKSQINKSEMSPNDCIKLAVENSWSGFKAEWIGNKNKNNGNKTKSSIIRDSDYN